MLFKSVALAALASLAAADVATILSSLATISADNTKLNNDLDLFNGNIIFALPILGDNIQLNSDLSNGTTAINALATLTVDEAVQLVAPVSALSQAVNATITNLISRKPFFAQDNLTGIVAGTLQITKGNADSYSSAIISKVPSNLQATAQSIAAPISAAFSQAIVAYSS